MHTLTMDGASGAMMVGTRDKAQYIVDMSQTPAVLHTLGTVTRLEVGGGWCSYCGEYSHDAVGCCRQTCPQCGTEGKPNDLCRCEP